MNDSKSRLIVALSVILFLAIGACSNSSIAQKQASSDASDHSNVAHTASAESSNSGESTKSQAATPLVESYLAVKNALVADDQQAAAAAGRELVNAASTFEPLESSGANQSELLERLKTIKEHGEYISKSEIALQREHFASLAKDFQDLLAITGTDRTLYEQYCPMYNNNEGGYWLSASDEIRNPLFGSRMLKCGMVKNVLNQE